MSDKLLLIFCALLMSSCATWDFPEAIDQALRGPARESRLYYAINEPTAHLYFQFKGKSYEMLKQAFVLAINVADPVETTRASEQGFYCLVTLTPRPPSGFVKVFGLISGLTLYALPYYDQSSGYIITYDLYHNREPVKEYHYEIRVKAVVWLGLLPFVWVNRWMQNPVEAFAATAMQFSRDAQRDGYF